MAPRERTQKAENWLAGSAIRDKGDLENWAKPTVQFWVLSDLFVGHQGGDVSQAADKMQIQSPRHGAWTEDTH